MATTALAIASNRENAQASTGPRTPEGKKRSAMNAIRHGLFAESPVLPGEDPAIYATFCQAYVVDLQPQGAIEEAYVTTLASTQWRLNRCTRIENAILGSEELDTEQQIDGLARFSLYEGRLSRKFNQTLRDLRIAQEARKGEEEAQIQEAVEVAAECKAANQPFDAAQFGFVFSTAEIQSRLHRRERLQAAQLRRSAGPAFQARCMKLPFRLVYHPGYDLNLGAHVFPSQKFRLIRERLLAEGFAAPEDFEEPAPADNGHLLLVHEAGWLERLSTFTLSPAERAMLEIPWAPETMEAVRLATGGSILASRNALRDGVGFNVGGGFHHAFPAHGEGFCAINDIAVAIRVLQRDRRIARAMVVDCDVHHGNGTAAIFAGDAAVATLSIHQLHNYPSVKPPSTVDIDLWDGVRDEEYLDKLSQACLPLIENFRPDLLLYVAGADPYIGDQLGGLALTMQGLQQRDQFVFSAAKDRGIPVAVVLAGGYARNVEDTVAIHCNTVKAAAILHSG